MNTTDCTPSTDSESTPIRFCRACGSRAATLTQHYVYKGVTIAPSTVASTCVESSCPLHLQTLSDNADLAPYHATAQYDCITGARLPKWARCSNVGTYKDTATSRRERIDIAVRSGK